MSGAEQPLPLLAHPVPGPYIMQQPNPWTDDWVTFFREHRLRHQLKLAGNSRLNQLAEPLLQLGAMESLFDGVQVKPSVLHGESEAVRGSRTSRKLPGRVCVALLVHLSMQGCCLSHAPFALHGVQATCGAATSREWMGSPASLIQPRTTATTRRNGA